MISTSFTASKMKVIALVSCLAALVLADPYAADKCSSKNCAAASGCRCSSEVPPIAVADVPQFITLTFSDAVTGAIYDEHLEPLLVGRTNPDGVQVGATFYVPHEYTDYESVNKLYNIGMDIAVHSISKSPLMDYWQQASEDTLYNEFFGQREILATFANIPLSAIVGARTPGFEMNGDKTFTAYERAGIQYDNSWVFRSNVRSYPYTLHFSSVQPCQIGTCPTESFAQTWVMPLIDLVGTSGIECNSVSGCVLEAESADDVKAWLMSQFERHYTSNRAPLTLNLNVAWFAFSQHNRPGLVAFLDELRNNYADVFLVDHHQVLDWMKSPVSAAQFVTKTTAKAASCDPSTCVLDHNDETRYMKTCSYCPDIFPWVGNPRGNA